MFEENPNGYNLLDYSNHYYDELSSLNQNHEESDINMNCDFNETENNLNLRGENFHQNANTNYITNEKRDEFFKTINEKEILQNNYLFSLVNKGNDILNKNNIDNNYEVIKEVKSIELNEDNEEYNKCKDERKQNKKEIFFIEKKYKYGRKTDEDKINGKKGVHTKDDEDNIISKIKSFFGKSLYNYLAKIISGELLKLDSNINKCLKKEFNLNLFKNKLKVIYEETEISDKYKLKNVKTNEKLIKRIYEEEKESEAIKILNLTYKEAFEIFRRNQKQNEDLDDDLKRKIRGTNILNTDYFEDANALIEKEIKIIMRKKEKNEDIEKYINNIKRLILEFEEWFQNKIGRER